jgi:hypothetical protein
VLLLIVEKNQFVIHLNADTPIDIALISDRDWKRIKTDTKFLMKTGHAKDPAQAYIAAFIVYLKDLEKLSMAYDSSKHTFI